ncbi:putative tubby-like protein [Helianthus debilis subsp. tardiflorus]
MSIYRHPSPSSYNTYFVSSSMSRVYPDQTPCPSPPPSYLTSKHESFTIWMKSLIFNMHGCTVYNSKGNIVYRVDNYNNKCGQEVYLMDVQGKILFSLLQKKLRLFRCWDGYKWDASCSRKQLWFRVRKHRSICLSLCDDIASSGCTYKIVRMDGKLGYKIVYADQESTLAAEFKQKQTTTGIIFGNDVFTLEVVQPHVNLSLIMAFIMVYVLINNQICSG